ncbi:MAG TPA: LytTR family DNA-binding domain-containing protein [Cryomorphaceae bacterium]|nr:LytTR family DNA-binding domain-containing protein [Cryomorphaceae bacterium]
MKALIVDDEQFCRDNLQLLIEEYCPSITQAKTAESAEAAREIISSFDPDVLFLDIKMPNETGFDLLNSLNSKKIAVIFTTAHREYALDALKAQAVDYLEKPINIDELQTAVKKIESKSATEKGSIDEIKNMLKRASSGSGSERIAIPMREGYEIISYSEIIHLEASESYTTIYLNNGKRLLSSKNIKVYEEKLDGSVFFRTHKSHIVNTGYHLKGFNRVDGNWAVLSNGKNIPISRRKVQSFLDRISDL